MLYVMVQVQALERQWRSQAPPQAQQRLVLVGHSFGSYIANLVRRGVKTSDEWAVQPACR